MSSQLVNDARKSLVSTVQILAEGYDEEDLQSLLNPRYLVPNEWSGSGFFVSIDGDSSYILTNCHVARNSKKLKIKTIKTSEDLFEVDLVGLVESSEPDIALLKISDKSIEEFKEKMGGEIQPLPLGDSNFSRRGIEIKAIGYPFGMAEPNVSGGEITNFLSGDYFSPERLVTDAAINPGNSGGPSIIEGGEVVGINTSIIVNANNIGFITPINYAKLLIPLFMNKKTPGLSDLGARFQANSKSNAKFLNLENHQGVIVTQIFQNGTLDKAGMKPRDVLIKIGGHLVDSFGNLKIEDSFRKRNIYDFVRLVPLGEEIEVTYIRNSEKIDLKVPTQTALKYGVPSNPMISNRSFVEYEGLVFQELSYEIVIALSEMLDIDYWKEVTVNQYIENPLVVVTYIDSDTEGEKLRISVGDVLTKVQGVNIKTLKDLESALNSTEKNQPLLFEFQSGRFGSFEKNTSHIKIQKPKF